MLAAGCPSSSGVSRSRGPTHCAARRNSDRPAPNYPTNGYFDEPDIHAPLYKPVVGNGNQDDTKRSTNRWDSDFIWNTNWAERWAHKDQQEADAKRAAEAKANGEVEETGAGFLGLARAVDLNDMSIDLSAQLRSKPQPAAAPEVPSIAMAPVKPGAKNARRDFPSAADSKRWNRRTVAGQRITLAVAESTGASLREDKVAKRAAEEARYEKLRQEYNSWTTATAAVCFAAVYAFYTRDVAASYLIGALGGIVYLRLLNNGVKSVGASTFAEAAGGAVGQQRLLIPVILVLFFNRYNTLLADDVGLHLELLPLLAGFFTYKAGVLGRSSVALFAQWSGKGEDSVESSVGTGTQPHESLAAVDDAVDRKVRAS